MRNLRRALVAGGIGFAVSFIAGCGGGAGLLSSDQANSLNNQLSQISSALSAGRCQAAKTAADQFVARVTSLPSNVDLNLRNSLGQGAATISAEAARQCHPATTQPTNTATTNSTTTNPPPPATNTSTAPATQPTTTPTNTTPTTPTTPAGGGGPPSGGGGLGGGGGTNNASGVGNTNLGGTGNG